MTLDSTIIFYAFRYALGRMTYAVQDVSDYIIAHWDQIHPREREAMKVEIKAAILMKTAGMDTDIKMWQRILAL